MKIVQINATYGIGSTGRICTAISRLLSDKDVENYTLYSLRTISDKHSIPYSNEYIRKIQSLYEKIIGNYGCGFSITTYRLLHELKCIKPDIVHLHNIHSRDCNFAMLFKYLRINKIKVFWTFHDCWPFTGYCSHYDLIECDHWKTECHDCPLFKEQSFFFDRSRYLQRTKKESYGEGLDMTIITPSQWLANQVYKSFLGHYPITVVNNGIDLTIFKHSYSTEIRKKLIHGKKHLVLGVSFGWSKRKGMDIFNYLAKNLGNSYQVVMVGVSPSDDLEPNIVRINRTNNATELVEIYSVADVFVNASREDTYPTVNMEAIACGTPIVSFDTGGSPEIIGEGCGRIVKRDDVEALIHEVIDVCNSGKNMRALENCAKCFDQNDCFKDYIKLYNL